MISVDTTEEPNETFKVNLSAAINATIVDGQGIATIENDDQAASTPRTSIEQAIAKLSPFAEFKDVVKALESILQSTSPSFWLDELHLDRQQGQRVFSELKQAITRLINLLKDKNASAEAKAAAQEAIKLLIEAARRVAETAINDLAARQVSASQEKKKQEELVTARKELAAGDQARDAGDWDKVIDSYRKAWEHTDLPSDNTPNSGRTAKKSLTLLPGTNVPDGDWFLTSDEVEAVAVGSERPVLSEPRWIAPSQLQRKIRGRTGRIYRIEVSPDLIHWETLSHLRATNVTSTISAQADNKASAQFYRVVVSSADEAIK